MQLQENVPLAGFTTLDVGGPARFFARIHTESDVLEALEFATARKIPLFVLGGGSNLVVSDRGFPGLVVKVEIAGISSEDDTTGRLFEVGAGEDWDMFVRTSVEQNCAGLECLSGIPGTVGGTPVQNVGAYGQDVSQTIEGVTAIEIATGKRNTFSNKDCAFAYRTSVFNTRSRDRYVLSSVRFRLRPGGQPTLSYRDISNHFAGNKAATLLQTRHAVREIRHAKAMLIVPGDDECRSAGSFFKNPVVDEQIAGRIRAWAAERAVTLSTYPAEGGVKIPAAWLVEQSGFTKGFTCGPVGISRRHALAIVNRGAAKAADVVALQKQIRRAVFDQFGIELKPEPVFVGFDPSEL